MEYHKISGIILDACITVHKIMGVGFLVNFNVPLLKDGFKRYVNNF
jgi:hypothetical protein